MKLDDLTKKEFPSQTANRPWLIIETIRANWKAILFLALVNREQWSAAGDVLRRMPRTERDLLCLPGGVLTDEQIAKVTDETKI